MRGRPLAEAAKPMVAVADVAERITRQTARSALLASLGTMRLTMMTWKMSNRAPALDAALVTEDVSAVVMGEGVTKTPNN